MGAYSSVEVKDIITRVIEAIYHPFSYQIQNPRNLTKDEIFAEW